MQELQVTLKMLDVQYNIYNGEICIPMENNDKEVILSVIRYINLYGFYLIDEYDFYFITNKNLICIKDVE